MTFNTSVLLLDSPKLRYGLAPEDLEFEGEGLELILEGRHNDYVVWIPASTYLVHLDKGARFGFWTRSEVDQDEYLLAHYLLKNT